MIFRFFEFYNQAKEAQKDPVGFGAGLGKEALSPLFILPLIIFSLGAIGFALLWKYIGWGIFMFVSLVFVVGILIVYAMHKLSSMIISRAENKTREVVSRFGNSSNIDQDKYAERNIVDVDSK